MKLDSKIFDKIRVKNSKAKKAEVKHDTCNWQGCDKPGAHKAPKGRSAEGQFYSFCVDHVRQYNKTYNYFDGMPEDQVADFVVNSARTGDRPTWGMGVNKRGRGEAKPGTTRARNYTGADMQDPFGALGGTQNSARNAQRKTVAPNDGRVLVEADRKALEMLGAKASHSKVQIKSSYKILVKKHHPDANFGNKGSEEKLRNIISAYNHLKGKGMV